MEADAGQVSVLKSVDFFFVADAPDKNKLDRLYLDDIYILV